MTPGWPLSSPVHISPPPVTERSGYTSVTRDRSRLARMNSKLASPRNRPSLIRCVRYALLRMRSVEIGVPATICACLAPSTDFLLLSDPISANSSGSG
jgi:hypothetical protein